MTSSERIDCNPGVTRRLKSPPKPGQKSVFLAERFPSIPDGCEELPLAATSGSLPVTLEATGSSSGSSPELISGAPVSRTAEPVLKRAASKASFGRHSAALASFRRGLLIRGSLVRAQLAEPVPSGTRTSARWRLTQPPAPHRDRRLPGNATLSPPASGPAVLRRDFLVECDVEFRSGP